MMASEMTGDASAVLDGAVSKLESHAYEQTDGVWLEVLTAEVAPHIRDWNIGDCWRWSEWPDRDEVMPEGTPSVDVGIDLVARRRDDGKWVAIQAKARQLDEMGEGAPILSREMNKFLSAAADKDIWAERWLAVNGNVPISGHSPGKVAMSGTPVKLVNVAQAVERQRAALDAASEFDQSPSGSAGTGRKPADDGEPFSQTRSDMQREAVDLAVERLRDNEQAEEVGIPRGEARGRIVLPCGAGKTRIALRIVEKLTYQGELSVVLCPSIALVAQIRREFLEHAELSLRSMAVCSDQGVAADEEKVANADDATLDRGLETVETLKGCPVTTDPSEIADWIRERRTGPASEMVSIIFGTYQSARRVSDGIKQADAADAFKVLICDEAHRTAGVRRRKRSTAADVMLSDFTLCHDRDAFPATYRVYQTATPRIYGDSALAETAGRSDKHDFVVRHMDDQSVFGVELYRRSYVDAVSNGWLSDYRIIAMGIGDQAAIDLANLLVRQADEEAARQAEAAATGGKPQSRSRRGEMLPTTGDYLKGMAFALAMGGGAVSKDGSYVPIKSCIGFLNTIARSKAMTDVLQSDAVKEWIAAEVGESISDFKLEHLDASTPVAGRDEAKRHLAKATSDNPHAVLNVGIFGEGTDSPSLSAVAFLEPRKSSIDVVQAVGRAMRRAQGKDLGYIVVPVVIPPGVDAERHLATSDRHEGWRELGDILQALRAHDKRIEDSLPEMLTISLPSNQPPPLEMRTVVAVGRPSQRNLSYAVVKGSRDDAEDIARAAVKQDRPLLDFDDAEPFAKALWSELKDQPTAMIVHVERPDGSTETREDAVVRHKPKPSQEIGDVNERQTKRRAGKMANGERGRPVPNPAERERQRKEQEAQKKAVFEEHIQGVLLDLSEQMGGAIAMNLLEKSGLTGNKVQRDLNLLRGTVNEAARYIHEESELSVALNAHFGLDQLSAPKQNKPRADGATIAALLWMNAAMLHQRIHSGGWLGHRGIEALADVKAAPEPDEMFRDSWQAITRQDFLPVIEPAVEALTAAKRTGMLGGFRRALRHIAGEAEMIAETYADMGTDHAGALFNEVMGDQSSDGAFFTRPVAADIAAWLALDAVDPDNDLDWSDSDVWRAHKTVDLACGSGTLLAAVMAEMKRRARLHCADDERSANLQKVAVEEVLKGLDVNPVSLQLAATQLMSGNADVKYRKMGLHLMPYGPQPGGGSAAGTLELLARSEIIDSGRLFDDAAESVTIKTGAETTLEGPEMDDAAAAAANARIVIMNPPFTNRSKAGEKFDQDDQRALRSRMDALEGMLVNADLSLDGVLDKNSIQPMFETLAGYCLAKDGAGVIVMIAPMVIATAASAEVMRLWMAERFHVHTILTNFATRDGNLSQNTEINESIFVFTRYEGSQHPSRIIRWTDSPPMSRKPRHCTPSCGQPMREDCPTDGAKSHTGLPRGSPPATGPLLCCAHLFSHQRPRNSPIPMTWQRCRERERERDEPSTKPTRCSAPNTAERRASETGQRDGSHHASTAKRQLPQDGTSSRSDDVAVHATGQAMRDDYSKQDTGEFETFPVLQSKGADGQQRIEAVPDAYWEWKKPGKPPILEKAGHLLVSMGHQLSTARLTAVASDERYVGQGWMPVTGLDPEESKATAVFLNSTPGRLLILRCPGKTLRFPFYNPAVWRDLPIPDLEDERIRETLAACWESTRHVEVPQFREGYCDVRRQWDEAVADALGWDAAHLAELGGLIAQEPPVRGLAYGQYGDGTDE
ncbi:MAG: DEAD/DEAH box helicase family protein [bacterium]|nr:DEAD/DEAH box helicase family protein [bacterium]